ncbi:hypothetical protein C8J57DRAFT_1083699 [Mycena rebaudengoi]|nr:hypothetical protein C8J57DRAFT_1083699 [Mycena rebaudengoi]
MTTLTSIPAVLCLSTTGKQVQLDPVLRFNCDGHRVVVTKLRGMIYHRDEHFTSCMFTTDGNIWFHDGITTRSSSPHLTWNASKEVLHYETNSDDKSSNLITIHLCSGPLLRMAIQVRLDSP